MQPGSGKNRNETLILAVHQCEIIEQYDTDDIRERTIDHEFLIGKNYENQRTGCRNGQALPSMMTKRNSR